MVSKQRRVTILQKTPLFSQLSAQECQKLAPVFKVRKLADGETLCRQGDTGDYMAIVADGELTIEVESHDGKATEVSRRTRCEAVGEMACLDPSPRSATVRADGAVTVLILNRSMLDSMRSNVPGLFSRVVRGIAYRLAEMLDEANELLSTLLESAKNTARAAGGEIVGTSSEGRPVRGDRKQLKLEPEGGLEGLESEELEVLRSVMEARWYRAGEIICVEGEPAPAAYFVVDGSVEVLRRIGSETYRLAVIGDGRFLGQRALLREGTRSATLRAGDDGTTLFSLSRQRFEALLEAESSLAIGFQEAVTITGIRQLRQANELAAYLGAREQNFEIPGPSSNSIKQQLDPSKSTQERVQDLVGSDEEEGDVETLASAYLETALEDWEMTPSELDDIQVVDVEGEMSAAEKKMRNKNSD